VKGKPITLKDCKWTKAKGTLGRNDYAFTSFRVGTIFVGDHFQSSGDFGFERLSVEYLHLDAWVGVSGFEVQSDSMTAHLDNLGDEYEVTLYISSDLTSSSPPTTETATQRAILTIKFSEKKSFDRLQDIAYRLQHLLSVGTRRSVYPVAMWGETGPMGEAERVEINYESIARRGFDKRRLIPNEMLFGLVDLPEGFGPAVEKWLERAEVLDTVNQLYLSTIYNPPSYLDQRFLNLVQALEVYHRRAMPSSESPEDEHKRRMKEILESVPEHYRGWLVRKLKHSNEPALADRLREIFRKYIEIVKPVVGKKKKARADFIEKVVGTRNYLTHFDENKAAKAARGKELVRITDKLKLLIEICLLGEIGFEEEMIRDLIER
jgi:hypothetical protein